MTLREILSEPVMWAAAIVTSLVGWVLGLAGWAGPAWQFLTSTAGAWFPAAALLPTIAKQSEAIPVDTAQTVMIVGAAVYLAVLASRFARKTQSFIQDR